MKKYPEGYNGSLHVTRNEFIAALNKAQSVKELCKLLGRSKPSVYTYAYRFGISLKRRWVSGIRKQDGYYHYENPKNHRQIMQKHLGKKLKRYEHVHHIDGDKLNNEIGNLVVVDWSQHNAAHNSLEKCALAFFKLGLIKFSKDYNFYYIDESAMPLNKKGKKILNNMRKEYGSDKKAKQVFYSSINAGKITGAEGTKKRKKKKKGK